MRIDVRLAAYVQEEQRSHSSHTPTRPSSAWQQINDNKPASRHTNVRIKASNERTVRESSLVGIADCPDRGIRLYHTAPNNVRTDVNGIINYHVKQHGMAHI